MLRTRNVLRVNVAEEQVLYRNAVAEILRTLQADDPELTLIAIAETIDCTVKTISNAANRLNDLNPLYLNRIGQAFGTQYLDPYAALSGGRIIKREPAVSNDVVPALTLVAHRISAARRPSTMGGTVEHLPDQLGYLPDLRRLYHDLGALICAIEQRRDAA